MTAEDLSGKLVRIEEQLERLRGFVDVVDGRVAELRALAMNIKESIAELEIATKEGFERVDGKLVGIEMEWEDATPRLRDIEHEVIVGSYRIVYRLSGESVGIIAVVHGSRGLIARLREAPWRLP